MAKSTNGLGKFSGKLGASVFAVRNGQQIIREKPVVVSNPKTMAQRLQRAKGNLVGQISRIVPYQILTSLGNNKPERRARFLRLALNGATSAVSVTDPNTITAKLDAPDFIFSEGAFLPTIYPINAEGALRSVNITLSRFEGLNDAEFRASGALVVVTVLTVDGQYESVLYRFVDASEFGASATLAIALNHINEGAYIGAVYVAPFATTDGLALRARANELFGENADFAASMVYNPSALPLVWGASKYYQNISFTPSSASAPTSKKK